MTVPTMPPASFVEVNGIRMGYYEQGTGPAIVLCHGWPELAYSWRYQIPALAAAGYRVIAPDQRGYGLTDRPEKVEDYDIPHLCGDLDALLTKLGIDKAVFVGHDWGGLVVWQMALLHPDRVAGVIGLNTPFIPRAPMDPIEIMRQTMGENMYIVFFQNYGVADKILKRDVRRVFESLMRSSPVTYEDFLKLPAEQRRFDFIQSFEGPAPAEYPGRLLLEPEELAFFVETYERTGFTGGINWYRNFTRNWTLSEGVEQKVTAPALMISAADDVVLPPAMTEGMEQYVPDLEKKIIPACGHWTQQEKPEETNRLMIDWLKRRYPAA
ncbi:alpha/beta fold hydrolase [Zavarzinia sp. CC-PAN008]|uniref:alpha/beta fold hydrolase n=1 Tax=Zavarzinia sp. CC-PAN008 TaxID=3243332 RepID=UPI003F745676